MRSTFRTLKLTLALSALLFVQAAALADQGSISVGPADPVLPLDGTWTVLDEWMSPGSFFTGTYTWDSPSSVVFTITDLYVVTDAFEVYDSGSLVLTTPYNPPGDWYTIGCSDPFAAGCWTDNPDTALAMGIFSGGTILFDAGPHSITIKDYHIPPTAGGGTFADGTVAFKAAVPEPATLTLFGLGVGALGLLCRRRTKKA